MAAATAVASSAGVRYAPEDPSLPKPWRGLIDGKTGYLYFWNPETKVTQYERPEASSDVRSLPSDNALSSSVQKESEHCECDGEGSNNGSAKFSSAAGADQASKSRSGYLLSDPEVTKNAVNKPIESKGAETGLSVEAYRLRHEITVTGGNVPEPFISFQSTGFPPEILREAQQAGFSAPTPIQAQSWPIAIQGRDIVAIAKTGSGKTLGYLIPGFIHLKQKRNNPKLGPTILVLSPTRELATQIQDEAVKFGKSSRIACTCLYGGAPKGPQLKDLDRGVDVVVATPGRLNDLLEMKRVYLHQISYLVLDEADRMLDMGFEPQIRKIVKEVPSSRQTLMYTATWPKEVRRIAADLLKNPVQVNIGNSDELVANKSITQYIEVLSPMDKRRRLEQILRSQEPGSKIIIFCSTKKMCDILSDNLHRQFGAAAIHGDKCQGERDHVLNQFRTGRSPVLVATDVAARGLDVKDIRVVVNYDFPTGIEDYVHRIGRTGRAFARSSLNHDDIFILDTKSKIYQFNGSNSSIQERAKALEVVQYIKDTYHDGKCEITAIDDGRLMADADTGEFWGFFGGFAPLPKKTATHEPNSSDAVPSKIFRVEKGETVPIEADSLTRDLLDTYKCYILDSGTEVFVWMGRNTSLDQRKAASTAADESLNGHDRPRSHVTRMIEGFETVRFRSKFNSWPQSNNVSVTEDGRGKVAALLKRQGINVKGLLKAETPKEEEPQPYIDCTGNLQVWRVDGQEKTLLSASDLSKFYSGDCYIFQYSYPGEEKDEQLIGTWIGKLSVEEDRVSATSQATKMVEYLKFLPTQARIYEGSEPIQFFAIFQSFLVFKGGLSKGYKNYIAEKELTDDTYSEEGLALFRVQGNGPEYMQAIQVEPVASSLNSSYCYILHSGSSLYTWSGSLTTPEAQEIVERQLDIIKPNMQSKLHKEGSETEPFWDILGGKSEYPSQKLSREAESDPHLFSCSLTKGDLKGTEVYNFDQGDLMTEDIFILDCHSDIYVWVGKQVDTKNKLNALSIGEKFLERDFLHEKLSLRAPIYIVMEGGEPPFFTRFFSWDSMKSAMHGNSFERKLAIVKNGGTPVPEKHKRRTPVSHVGRSAAPAQSRGSRSMSFSPDRVRVRGRSPAFNALAANFENVNTRNMSTPPPMVRKVYPKSVTPDSEKTASRSSAIAALSSSFEKQRPPARQFVLPRSTKASPDAPKPKPKPELISKQNSVDQSPKAKPEPIQEDVKENEVEDEEGLTVYPYERLKTTSTDPVVDIDVTKRETYLSLAEFKEIFGISKEAFYKLPKWKQNKLKMSLQLF